MGSDNNAIVVQVQQLRYHYSKRQKNILDVPHWQVKQGERVFLYGASGSGKTTFLNLLSGILLPRSGSVHILGQNLAAMRGSRRDAFRAQHIGVVFQQFNLIPYLTVLDNIRLAARFAGTDRHGVPAQAETLLARLQLPASVLQQRASQLSVGQQQRVAIARALINQPQLLIADEPTSALDNNSRDRFIQLLQDVVQQQGSSLIFVSHDQSLAQHFSRADNLNHLNQVQEAICY